MKFNQIKLVTAAALALGIVFASAPTSAFATTTTTASIAVTAAVGATCAVTASPLTFSAYTSAQASTGSATLAVTCTNTTGYTIGLNAGTGTGATDTARVMLNGTQKLNYNLYSDSSATTIWGNTAGTGWISKTGTGAAQPLTVYGAVPASQYPTPGSYADTITVTVSY